MKIKNIFFKEIFDSRGEKTIEVEVVNYKNLSFRASVPAGKSRGKNEAFVLNPSNICSKSYHRKIKVLEGKNFNLIQTFDNFLLKLDGTKNKSNLGGNAMIALSLAFARGLAFEKKVSLGALVSQEFFQKKYDSFLWKPVIFSNLINGGVHSSNSLNIQEYLVLVPIKNIPLQAIEDLLNFYKLLGDYLKKIKNVEFLAIGDEGGYSLNFKNNFEPIKILYNLIKKYKFNFALGLDIAASNFKKKDEYLFEGKKISSGLLASKYLGYFKRIPILESIEDPFGEDEAENFGVLKQNLPKSKIIVGDDLTVTNPYLISKYYSVISGIIIKPNQIGTLTETLTTCLLADKYKIKTIFSHRSGETEDNFIVELASAVNAFGLKIGAPTKERIAKFNEVLRLTT